jgi:hypothetical protein
VSPDQELVLSYAKLHAILQRNQDGRRVPRQASAQPTDRKRPVEFQPGHLRLGYIGRRKGMSQARLEPLCPGNPDPGLESRGFFLALGTTWAPGAMARRKPIESPSTASLGRLASALDAGQKCYRSCYPRSNSIPWRFAIVLRFSSNV